MSFAASLLRTNSDITRQFHAEIDAWVSQQVDKTFKPACDAAARKGASSAFCTSGPFRQVGSMSPMFMNEQEQQDVLDAVTTCFLAKLAALGFATCGAKPSGLALHPVDGRNQLGYRWSLSASWLGVPEQEEAPQRLASGASAQCPVCLEFTNVVALFPCGHTMCRACAGRIVHAACPSCRQLVIGVSQGLFLV
mmetsp:Transcript_124883/g.399250  ORF Transcript_124883/g.399250 Transcript_124883/m.399250 type:complete len:194 (+) Transcript_124883:142-723(+)